MSTKKTQLAARILGAAALLALLLMAPVSQAKRHHASHHKNHMLGVVMSKASTRAHAASGPNDLAYHGGRVLKANTTYTIFWTPSGSTVSSGYAAGINTFLGDVAKASKSVDNVYSTDTQYFQPDGAISYSSTYGGTYTDTTTPIPDNCSGEYASTTIKVQGCVLDTDIQAEVSRVIAKQHWSTSPNNLFMVITPRNVGSCFDATSGTCAYSYFCAYHSSFTDAQNHLLAYTDQPYSDATSVGAPGACDSGQHPNGDLATDSTISLISHEHNESITDPDGNAWFNDASGGENGDNCNFNFGTPLGSVPNGSYNQVINGNKYWLQQEWSNASSSCAQSYAQPAPTISSAAAVVAASAITVTIDGTNLLARSAKDVKLNGLSATALTINSASEIVATLPAIATSGALTVTTGAGSASTNVAVVVLPTITSFSPGSGPVGTVVTITGTGFTGVQSVNFNGTAARFMVYRGRLYASVPAGATTGPIGVTTAAGTAKSRTNFTVKASRLPVASGKH